MTGRDCLLPSSSSRPIAARLLRWFDAARIGAAVANVRLRPQSGCSRLRVSAPAYSQEQTLASLLSPIKFLGIARHNKAAITSRRSGGTVWRPDRRRGKLLSGRHPRTHFEKSPRSFEIDQRSTGRVTPYLFRCRMADTGGIVATLPIRFIRRPNLALTKRVLP